MSLDNYILIEMHEYVDVFVNARVRALSSKTMHGLLINERDNQVLSSQSN